MREMTNSTTPIGQLELKVLPQSHESEKNDLHL